MSDPWAAYDCRFVPNLESTSSSSSNIPTKYTPISSGSSHSDEDAAEPEYRDPSPVVYPSDFTFNQPSIRNFEAIPMDAPLNISNQSPRESFGVNSQSVMGDPTMNFWEPPPNDLARFVHNSGHVALGNSSNISFSVNYGVRVAPSVFTVAPPVEAPSTTGQLIPSVRSRPAGGRVRSLSPRVRKQAAETRKTGACIPCKRSKQSCDPGPGPCQRCLSALTKAHLAISFQPCWRVRVMDIEIFRRGPTEKHAMSRRGLKFRKEQLSGYQPFRITASKESTSKWVEVTQDWTDRTLTLQLDEYQPKATDRQYYKWFEDGIERHYDTPPYAIAEYDDAIDIFLKENEEGYVRAHMKTASDITKRTFEAALAKKKDLYLIRLCLKFWAASRFIEKPWRIAGSETLGMRPDTNPSSPFFGRVPVPTVVANQIDLFVSHEQLQRKWKTILKILEDKMMKNNKEEWFEIHLAYSILLHSVELTMAHDVEFAREQNLPEKFSNKPLINMVWHGACTLLTLFHYAHRGSLPFCSDVVNSSNDFKPEERSFVNDVSMPVWRLKSEGGSVHDPAQELYWISKLYKTEWSPVSICV